MGAEAEVSGNRRKRGRKGDGAKRGRAKRGRRKGDGEKGTEVIKSQPAGEGRLNVDFGTLGSGCVGSRVAAPWCTCPVGLVAPPYRSASFSVDNGAAQPSG